MDLIRLKLQIIISSTILSKLFVLLSDLRHQDHGVVKFLKTFLLTTRIKGIIKSKKLI